MPKRRPDQPIDVPSHRQPVRLAERTRRAREADLIPVDCRSCGEPLATVAVGAEAFCRTCRVWTSSLTSQGVVLA